MRASYVNGPELLTPVGEWIASRLPHIDSHKGIWGPLDGRVFRIFAGRHYYRNCIFNYTATTYRGMRAHSVSVGRLGFSWGKGSKAARANERENEARRRMHWLWHQTLRNKDGSPLYPHLVGAFDSWFWTGR